MTLPAVVPRRARRRAAVLHSRVGEFVIPDLLGGSQAPMIGQTIWTEFFGNKDWPAASAVAVVLIGLLVTPIVIFQHQTMRAAERS